VTAYSFLGFYNGFTNYVGEDKDIVSVYSQKGSTPFTGIVSINIADLVATQRGVIATSPEVIAPCTINNQSIFIRGIIPNALTNLNDLPMQEGQSINLNDTDSCIVGSNLANKLQLKSGDKIIAIGVLSSRYVELQVKGIFYSNTALNDEALVPLYVGQWLRGLDYNSATLIRVKIDLSQTSVNQIYMQITNQTAPINSTNSISPTPTPNSQTQRELEALIPLVQANINVGTISIAQSQQFMQSYLSRYGISKDTLIILSLMVLVFASATAISAITLFVKQHSSDIVTIRSIGVSTKKVKIDLTAKITVCALIATILGTLLSTAFISVFQSLGYLEVLSHTIAFQLDPVIIIANFLLLTAFISITIVRMDFN
jgi:ABC-type lipoprotein release transport system permease subunit